MLGSFSRHSGLSVPLSAVYLGVLHMQNVPSWTSLWLSAIVITGACANPTDMTEPENGNSIREVDGDDVAATSLAVIRGPVYMRQDGIGVTSYVLNDVYFEIEVRYVNDWGVSLFTFENNGPGQARIGAFLASTCEAPSETGGKVIDFILEPGQTGGASLGCTRTVAAGMQASLDN
jgi:hypothetical protein